ncbi:MAG TPA: hypothetical protein DCE23_00740 [Firmicutes bacterium]|nr:hypothetical protein [Bacillota bacterium]
MGLFDVFRDTVFLKEDSSLEKQIDELKKIRDNVSDKDKIDKDIKLLELGLQGEKEIAFELKNANIGMYVLHDVTLSYEDLKAQIDYVIVTKGYTYLVECKNLLGDIIVDNQGQFMRSYEVKGKKIKEGIYSPYTQAVRHKEILKKRWLSKRNKLQIMLWEKSFENMWYKPLVVLSNSKCLLNTKYAPNDVKKNTIRVDQLVGYIKRDLERYDHDMYSSKKNMVELAESFLKDNEEVEYYDIASRYQKDIECNKKNKSVGEKVEIKVCPKCGGKLVLRNGQYGEFYGCSNFPQCRFTLKK